MRNERSLLAQTGKYKSKKRKDSQHSTIDIKNSRQSARDESGSHGGGINGGIQHLLIISNRMRDVVQMPTE